MHFYVNDLSLQGQFSDDRAFESLLRGVLWARTRMAALQQSLRTTHSFQGRRVGNESTVRVVVQRCADRDLIRAVLGWLDRDGPFVEDDRLEEADDYFECGGLDVTESGLGEAARRVKSDQISSTFSFPGGEVDFATSPLFVDHGLPEARMGGYAIENVWTAEALVRAAESAVPAAASWRSLVEYARDRFPRLLIPDAVYENAKLRREPFEASIRDRVLPLLKNLETYVGDCNLDGAEGPLAREIIREYFTGDRALFSRESASNLRTFEKELTFPDPLLAGRYILAQWHGKISHRAFRLHFEWPLPRGAERLKILYLGPKITRS